MKINLNSVFKLLITALALSLALLFCSCGARKAEKNRTKETIKAETSIAAVIEKKAESNVKKTENTIIDDKNETTTKETTYEPIDPSKPASIIEPDGRKTDLNNSKKTTRETTQKNNTKIDNSKKYDEFHKSELSEQSESNNKATVKKAALAVHREQKPWNPLNLLWLLIPAAVIWWVWKNKTKIIGWFNGLWFI